MLESLAERYDALESTERPKGSPEGRSLAAPVADGELFRLTFEKAAVGIALLDRDLRFLRVNPSFAALLGYAPEELAGRPLQAVLHPEEAPIASRRPWAGDGDPDAFHFDVRLLRRDGATVWTHASVSVVRDGGDLPLCYVAMAEDITQRKRDEEELKRRHRELQALAATDAKTGLYNARYLYEFLAQSLAESRHSGEPVSVLMLDVDHFHQFNERYGHDAGDLALQRVAESLRRTLRERDVACRYGGEEFVVVLQAAEAQALAAAERLRRQVATMPPITATGGRITCSIGVATYPTHASTAESLLKAADIALYEAKRAGRDAVRSFERLPSADCGLRLEQLTAGLQGASPEAVKALVTAIDLRDRFTGAHCQRVARLAVELASRLGFTEREIELLRLGGSLLDVGKIGLPDHVLTKTGELTPEEWALMRQHPIWGEQLVLRSQLPREVAQLVRWHHERLDGSGYPDGLAGDRIPPLVRVVAVADVATALRDDRPHRRAWSPNRTVQWLKRQAGDKLDAGVVDAYCELYG